MVKIQTSEIQKAASKPTIFPNTDVVHWVASHVDFWSLSIVSDNEKVLGSLTPKNFQNIYHLKPAEARCNKEYLDNFYIENLKAHVLMKPWYQEEEDLKDRDGSSKIHDNSVYSPYTIFYGHVVSASRRG